MASEKSRILIIGGTGYIGKYVVFASAKNGNPTFVLCRNLAPSDPAKLQLLQSFTDSGAVLVQGDLYDHGSLVRAIKTVDVVISTVGFEQLADQSRIIAAIKEAGNVKRFVPSEFGNDVNYGQPLEPVQPMFVLKSQIRKEVIDSGIPYTFVCNNFFAGVFLPTLGNPAASGLPTDHVVIWGDGNVKAIYTSEPDVGMFAVKAVDDPRTANKCLYFRLPGNVLTQNELVELWEKKVGKSFQRVHVSENDMLDKVKESPLPLNILLGICHGVYIKGDQSGFEIDPAAGVEVSELYPEVKYTTVDEFLTTLQ